jgi:osmotically-inducible protein OsmY
MKTQSLVLALSLFGALPAFAADSAPDSDAAITAKVQAALAADKRLQVKAPLDVSTRGGVVKISGDVESASMVYRAVETTRTVEGVKDVDTHQLDAR